MEKMTFTEHKMPKEPNTDTLLHFEDGTKLRERIVSIESIIVDASPNPNNREPAGLTLRITHAMLTQDERVEQDEAQRHRISPPHEVLFTDDALARLGDETTIVAALRSAREEAAARALQIFKGRTLMKQALLARLVQE
jgi:hypothetical protein